MRKYKLEIKKKDRWEMQGMYTDKSIAQMIQAVVRLGAQGYAMYDTLRIWKVKAHGKPTIL